MKILCGGEALPPELAAQLLARCGSLWNMYGPTETTVWSTVYQIDPEAKQVSIGRPIANTEVYLLDSNLQSVPVGVPGELYIGGTGLARGYLNRPELTAEKFIRNPFSDDPQSCLYKTGDLARYLPDGNLEFLGRADHQVKIRGYRVELGEIEVFLRQYSSVQETVAIVREDRPGDKRLVAYLVAVLEQTIDIGQIRGYLKEKLPDYMIPSAFVILEALPMTPNGKIDRRALPMPDSTRPELAEAFVAPEGPVEEMLAEVWQEVLGIEQIGTSDNFFELGGHSLLATRAVSRLLHDYGVELPLRYLFEYPTIAELAPVIEEILIVEIYA